MAGKFSSHVRSNVVGYIALFFALGLGSAWAATELDKNEVKSKHIKNAGVKTKDLANNAVTSPKVANGSLLDEDFAAGQLPQGLQGPEGPQGDRGAEGAQGVPGTARAYGMVRDDCAATCPLERSNGITSVTRPQTGVYCIQVAGIDGRQVAAVASADFFNTLNADRVSAMSYNTTDAVGVACPRSSDVVVLTHVGADVSVRNAADDGAVTVADDAAGLSNNVTFNVVIP